MSVASNLEGYEEPQHYVTDGDSQKLVDQTVVYLQDLSRASYERLSEVFKPTLEEIEERFEEVESLTGVLGVKRVKKRVAQLERLRDKLEEHISVLPVLGFNSQKYDINLIKKYLYPSILKTEAITKIIKRGRFYQCVQTESLKFLDVTDYLAPGYSYRHFLKAYVADVGKGFFPYEWLDTLEKLQQPELPPHEAAFSQLKNSNISKEEYEYCKEIWMTRKMKTVGDFLEWYNDLDVRPFLTALENMFGFHKSLGIDIFKEAITVPGVTLKYLFGTLGPDVSFSLFKEDDKDLYYKMRQNIVGGPSLVFHRYHEKNETTIRNETKVCKEVDGFDANALYLWALMQQMPTGTYIRRSDKDGFKPVRQYYYGEMAVQWLEWIATTQKISIRHMFNGVEHRIGHRRIPVDGYCASTKTVFQFHGCYFHGHECALNTKTYNEKRQCSMADLRQETAATSAYTFDLKAIS